MKALARRPSATAVLDDWRRSNGNMHAANRPVLIVAGPTGSGKSALAVDAAEAFEGLVVNADSMQVYRELRVLTARPSPEDEVRVPHRLFGVLPAAERCSAGRWLGLAQAEIDAAWSVGPAADRRRRHRALSEGAGGGSGRGSAGAGRDPRRSGSALCPARRRDVSPRAGAAGSGGRRAPSRHRSPAAAPRL